MASSHLPLDVVTDILSRLPVKSLLRFKSVCKNWYALIESSTFIVKHRTQFTLNSNVDSNAFLLVTDNYKTPNQIMYLHFNNDVFDGLINLDFPFLYTVNEISVLGICDGLVCLNCLNFSNSGPLIVCNPATGQFREIPDCKWWDDNVSKIMWVTFGFGFHPKAEDHVLIRIMCGYFKTGRELVRTDMYMMGTDTWRELDVTMPSAFDGEVDNPNLPPCALYRSSASVFLNGVLYSPAKATPSNDIVIAALDLRDEVFQKIRTPFYYNLIEWEFVGLKDKLAMVICSYSLRCFEVWVLSEDQRSWTYHFRVGPFSPTSGPAGGWKYGATFVGLAKNGELILRVNTESGGVKLYLCDAKTQAIKDLPFDHDPCPYGIFVYVETLLPVKKNDEC